MSCSWKKGLIGHSDDGIFPATCLQEVLQTERSSETIPFDFAFKVTSAVIIIGPLVLIHPQQSFQMYTPGENILSFAEIRTDLQTMKANIFQVLV